jgi:hypothetical protein
MNSDDYNETLGPGCLHIVGQDPAGEEEKETYIEELVKLKKIDAIAYERRRNAIARLIPCNKTTLDAEVKARLKAETDDDGDVVRNLIEIGLAQELWHNGHDGFVTVDRDGHLEHYKVDHPRFRGLLNREYGKTSQHCNAKGKLVPTFPRQKDLNEAIYQLNLHAINEGEAYEPKVRLAYFEGALWLDLGRQDWKCVRLTADGWEVLDRCKAKIIRGDGAKALPIPVSGGDIRDLRRFVNVRDESALALFVGQAVGQYKPFGNYTTTFYVGPAASAKTSGMRVMRNLVDPHGVMERRFSTVRDLMHGLDELYHIIKPLALRREERFEGKFPATSAVMGKELPRSIGALHKVHGISVRRFRLDDGNKNGIEIWRVSKGRQFPSPDEGPEKEEPSPTF